MSIYKNVSPFSLALLVTHYRKLFQYRQLIFKGSHLGLYMGLWAEPSGLSPFISSIDPISLKKILVRSHIFYIFTSVEDQAFNIYSFTKL